MVLYASDFDQSKYLKAADIGDVGAEKRLNGYQGNRRRRKRGDEGVRVVYEHRQRAAAQQDQSAGAAERFRQRHEPMGRQDRRRVRSNDRLPRQNGPRFAGAHSAAERRLQSASRSGTKAAAG